MRSEENDRRMSFNQNNALVYTDFCLENRLPRTGTWKKAKRHRRTLNSEWRTKRTGKSWFKIVFLGVDRDKSGRIGFFGSSGGTSGFGLQIGTVPTRSGRLASMLTPMHYPCPISIHTCTPMMITSTHICMHIDTSPQTPMAHKHILRPPTHTHTHTPQSSAHIVHTHTPALSTQPNPHQQDLTCANHVDVLTIRSVFPSNVHINILRGLPCRLESQRLKFTNEPSIFVDGDLAESIKRSASDRLGDLVLQVRAQTSPGFFTAWRF